MKMSDKKHYLYIFQDDIESQNIWDKILSCKSFAIKHF